MRPTDDGSTGRRNRSDDGSTGRRNRPGRLGRPDAAPAQVATRRSALGHGRFATVARRLPPALGRATEQLVKRAGGGIARVRRGAGVAPTARNRADTPVRVGGRAPEAGERDAAAVRVGPVASARRGAALRIRGGAVAKARGIVFVGTLWPGAGSEPFPGLVVLDTAGVVRHCGPLGPLMAPPDLPTYGGDGYWIGPGIIDSHVHLAFGGLGDSLLLGLVAVRDLGAPAAAARSWRTGHRRPPRGRPFVATAGPVITATGGYPSPTWGRDGFALFVDTPAQARAAVQTLASDGADVIKIALEPGPGWPVPSPATVRAAVDTAHSAGLSVVAHALRADMVARALDAGVDELAHTPTERLPDALIERIAGAGIAVVSTLQTFFSDGVGRDAAANAADLVEAGVVLRYGTDLGNAGTRPGVDPRELDRLADAGLGRLGALVAATRDSARAPGIRRRTGLLRVGQPGHLVLLPADPLREPGAWRAPSAVLVDGRLHRPAGADLTD